MEIKVGQVLRLHENWTTLHSDTSLTRNDAERVAGKLAKVTGTSGHIIKLECLGLRFNALKSAFAKETELEKIQSESKVF